MTEGFALYPTRLEDAGTRSIEVNYEGLLCYFQVEVEPAPEVIEGIGVAVLPNKVVYEPGESLEPAGLSIRVYTNNGTRDVSAEELDCMPTVLDTPGQQVITVYYGEKTCTFTVQVLEEEAPAGIAVYRLPDKLDYTVGDTLDPSGLILVETSSRDTPDIWTRAISCEPTLLEEPGPAGDHRALRESCSAAFHVTVRPAPAAPPPSSRRRRRPVPVCPPRAPPCPAPELSPERTGGEEPSPASSWWR